MTDQLSVLNNVNEQLGDNFDNLIGRCNAYKEVLHKRNHEITEKIKSRVVGENSSMVKKLNAVREDRLLIIKLKQDIEQLKCKYSTFREETESIRCVFKKLIEELNYNCNRLMYYMCLQCVTSKSNKIRANLASKRDNEAVKSYTILCELSFAMNDAPCKHLVSYLHRVINYWHSILERHYSENFEVILKQIKWPYTMNESMDAKLENSKQKFHRLASLLMKIKLPKADHIDSNDESSSQLLEHFSQINLPIAMLIVPFRKRFFFHFTGNKQTNKPDKPEWFLSKILSWIRDYRSFVMDWMGPVFKENDKRPTDAQNEFIIGLLQSVVIKLESDLSHFQLEDIVFSHIVDETLSFEHELRKVYGYPDECPSVTEVLTQAHIFFKWINMERKYANMKVDVILQNSDPWKVLVNDSQYCMTACADSFLTLLNTMSDRYSILRQTRHKLQFLKLQIDLLEEFRQKIIDSANESHPHENLPEILCTLHYISYILHNWGTNMHFLSLLNYKCELENEVKRRSESESTVMIETSDTVFDDTIKLYNSGIDRLLNSLCDNIMTKVKRSAKEYKRDKWHIMNSLIDENKYSITDSSWIMYETFTENLNTLNKLFPTSLFNKCWPILGNKMSTFVFYDVLMANMFNKGGAQHLLCDVRYKMIPILSKYTTKPSIYIERLLEACRVLCFEPNFKPLSLTHDEVSEILLRRIEHGNLIE